jgi:hydrogenase-4 component D
MIAALSIAMILLPVAAGLVCAFLRERARLVALASALLLTGVLVWVAISAFGTSRKSLAGDLPWLHGIMTAPVFGVAIDPLALLMLLVIVPVGLLTVLYSTSYLTEKNREHPVGPRQYGRYYFWLMLFIGSMTGVALSPNFLQFLFFWEMTTLCSWALISFHQDERSLRAGFKAMLITQAGGAFLVVAVLILFAKTGSFEFSAVATLPGGLRNWVFFFILIAAWAKAGQVPLQTWLPDAMEAPTPVSAYLHAAAMVKGGVYLAARTVSSGWSISPGISALMAAMALLTIFVALSFYFVQDDLKRLLAYSTIAHLGYVLLGIAIGGMGARLSYQGAVLHILCHGVSKATLFFCVGAIAYATGTRRISALHGLAKSMPLTATAFFVGLLSVTGVPPLACFWSKFMILAGAMRLSGALGPAIVALLLCETLISFGWMLYVGQKVFQGATLTPVPIQGDLPWRIRITLIASIIGCLTVPLAGIPLVRFLET